MKFLAKLEKSRSFWFLLFTSVVFFLLRFPSLFEPHWYGDEGIYQALGLVINDGGLVYRDVFDNKPPFLYYLYSFFNSEQFLLRSTSLIFGLLTVFVFFKLAQNLINKTRAIYISTFLFAVLFGLPLIEGNIANAENFMLLFNVTAAFIIYRTAARNEDNLRAIFLAGVILGVSFLFKIVAIFDFVALLVFITILHLDKDIKRLKPVFYYAAGFFMPILITAFYFLIAGGFTEFFKATFANNIGYVGYGNKFIIPQGLLYLKLFVLALVVFFLFLKRNTLDKKYIFIFLWVSFSVFNALFAQRPYTHYVLVTLPALILLLGLVLEKGRNFKLSVIFLFASLYLILSTFSFSGKTLRYYPNYIAFVTGFKSVYDYNRFFDRNTPRDYEIAGYIKENTEDQDKIFIWGNNAQLYKMTNKNPITKYTVAYHITNYKDGMTNTSESINNKKPKIIVVMNNVAPFPFSLSDYFLKINIRGADIYERIY